MASKPQATFEKTCPLLRIIVVSNHSDSAYVNQAFQSGVQAYVLEGSAASKIHQAIEAVMDGRTFREGC
jgi:DNA-binding NarL/FixJ family response regulator